MVCICLYPAPAGAISPRTRIFGRLLQRDKSRTGERCCRQSVTWPNEAFAQTCSCLREVSSSSKSFNLSTQFVFIRGMYIGLQIFLQKAWVSKMPILCMTYCHHEMARWNFACDRLRYMMLVPGQLFTGPLSLGADGLLCHASRGALFEVLGIAQ